MSVIVFELQINIRSISNIIKSLQFCFITALVYKLGVLTTFVTVITMGHSPNS